MITLTLLFLAIGSTFIVFHVLWQPIPFITKLAASSVVGMLVLAWVLFLCYALFPQLLASPLPILLLLVGSFSLLAYTNRTSFHRDDFQITLPEIILLALVIVLSIVLMFGSLSYDAKDQTLQIGSHLWSDFGSHVPLIRSFSLGYNFPPQFPLFPNEPIHYHFLLYSLAGILEKLGSHFIFSLNVASALSFTALCLLLFSLARHIFQSKYAVGVIAVVLTLCNGSLAFWDYFKTHTPFARETYSAIIANKEFLAHAPYGEGPITAFWQLNIYLNQRHLAGALAIGLFIIYLCYDNFALKKPVRTKQLVAVGVILGLLPFYHAQVFVMVSVVIVAMALLFFGRQTLFRLVAFFLPAAIIALPQLLWLGVIRLPQALVASVCTSLLCQAPTSLSSFAFAPGYLVPQPITAITFITWWVQNLGLSAIVLTDVLRNQKRQYLLLYASFVPIFLMGYLFRFSPDIATNHKFFNFWLMLTNMFIAAWLVNLWHKHIAGKVITGILLLFLTLTGILEFFPIINDMKFHVGDWKTNPVSTWAKTQTDQSAVFLTSNDMYHPVSLAGRNVFMGWPYFAWSAGADTDMRGHIVADIYNATERLAACSLLRDNNISFVTIEEGRGDNLYSANKPFFDLNFIAIFSQRIEPITFTFYDVKQSCN